MFELVILFTGLCAYVPEFPITPENNGFNQMRVLMPVAHNHKPVLLVKKTDLDMDDPPDFCGDEKHKDSVTYYECDLTRRLVTIAPSRQNKLAFVTGRVGADACPQNGDERDFSWVVGMDTVHDKDVSASSSCHYYPEMEPLRLNAQVLLTEGVVEVGSFSRLGYDNGKIAIWEFGAGGARQALADVVRFKRDVVGNRVRLDIMDLATETWHEIVLEHDSGPIVVEIKNVHQGDTCRTSPGQPAAVGTRDPHFYHLNKMLEGYGHTARNVEIVSFCSNDLDHPPEVEGFCLRFSYKQELVGNPQCPGASADPP